MLFLLCLLLESKHESDMLYDRVRPGREGTSRLLFREGKYIVKRGFYETVFWYEQKREPA